MSRNNVVALTTITLGHAFGTACCVVRIGERLELRHVLHVTGPRPYKFTQAALADGRAWAEAHGYTVANVRGVEA